MVCQLWRSVTALAAAAVFIGVVLLVSAAPASAHADLLDTSPRADQVLESPPADVELRFSDTVDLSTALVQVIESDGETLTGVGAPARVKGLTSTVGVRVPDSLGRGTRTVIYRVVSADDGHLVQGAFQFSIGVATVSATPDVLGDSDTDSKLELYLGIARWVAFVGLALAIGTLLLVFLAWPGGLAVPAVRRLLWTGLGSLSVASVASLLLYGPYISGTGLSDIADTDVLDLALATRVGRLLVVRLALLAGVGGALYLVFRRRSRPATEKPGTEAPQLGGARPAVATLGVGGALALTWSLAGHGAAGGGKLIALPVDLAHILAMSAWLGGMPALLVLVLKVRDGQALARAVPAFSRTAAVCVTALVLTGVVQAWRQVGSADALRSTTYGGWLIVKLALVVVILGLGALTRWWAAPRLGATPAPLQRARRAPSASVPRAAMTTPVAGAGRLGRLVALETGVGALVLAVTATLVSTQPAGAAHRSQEVAAAAKASPVMLAASPVDTTVGFRLAAVSSGQEPVAFVTPLMAPPGAAKGRGWVQAVISPAFNGLPNELRLSVTDDRGRLYPIGSAAIDLRAVGGPERSSQFPLRSTGPGRFVAAFTVPSAGQWQLGITLRDVDGREAVVLVPFAVKALGP